MDSEYVEKTIPEEIRKLCYYRGSNGEEIPVFPYVIAVTGHRHGFAAGSGSDLPGFDEGKLKDAFKRELEGIAKKWRKTSKGFAPIVLLTGLADGADQIAAEAALELDEQLKLNVKVVAVLPMERDIFSLTLENEDRFKKLLERVHYRFALPLVPENVGREAELRRVVPETEETRQRQYVQLAGFLARHSHVLFAFWDGVGELGPGGTANVVHFKLHGSKEFNNSDDFLTNFSVGPVVHLLTPRDNEANRAEPFDPNLKFEEVPVFFWTRENLWVKDDKSSSGSKKRVFPERLVMTEGRRLKKLAAEAREIKNALKKMGGLNADAVKRYEELKRGFKEAENDLWREKKDPKANLDAGAEVLVDHYLVADQLANLFQDQSHRLGRLCSKGKRTNKVNGYPCWVAALCLLGCLVGFFDEFHDNVCNQACWSNSVLWILRGAYWFVAGVIVFIYVTASVKNFLHRHFRSRAVAEALRVQIFWRIAEMNDCVSCYYRSHQIDDSEWLRATVNGLVAFLPPPEPSGFKNKIGERLTFVRDVWIKGQLDYFENGIAERRKDDASKWERPWLAMALFGIVVVVGPLQSEILLLTRNMSPKCQCGCLIVIGLCGVVAAFGAAVFVHQAMKKRLLCHKLEADRYERMILPYDRAILLTEETQALDPASEERWRQIFRQLGAEAITENADWLLTVGERELLLPR